MTYEVEIKIQLTKNELKKIENYIQAHNIKFIGQFTQTDNYFDTNPPTFAISDQALRIRSEISTNNSKPQIEITYKGTKIRANTKTRKELNLILNHETQYNQVSAFLQALSFKPGMQVKKIRKNYVTRNITISIDEVESLGTFMELETIAESIDDTIKAENNLWNLLELIFLENFSNDRSITKSYLELILES